MAAAKTNYHVFKRETLATEPDTESRELWDLVGEKVAANDNDQAKKIVATKLDLPEVVLIAVPSSSYKPTTLTRRPSPQFDIKPA